MTISSSLNAGVSGLSANATKLASISDNIANSSTFGYKRVQTDFASLVLGSQGSTYAAGGTRAYTQRLIGESGSIVSSSNATDLAVRGRGMLPVTPLTQATADNGQTDMLLTTTGSFRTDANGYLVTQSGLVLLGWPALADGTIPPYPRDTADGLQPVQINVNNFSGDPTTKLNLGINLPATETGAGMPGTPQQLTVEYYDNLGKSENINVEFVPTIPAAGFSNEWTMTLRDSAAGNAIIGEYQMQFDDSRALGGTLASVTTLSGGAYDPATGSVIVNVAGGPMEIGIGAIGGTDGLTQLSDQFAPVAIQKDGTPVGSMIGVQVDETGLVTASFDTGVTRAIFQVPLVDLQNPNGMRALDNQTYKPSPDSGAYFLWDAGEGSTGDIISYAREESTTDVASELTAMIQTQRAYSSNATVIQTVDEMLQETTNIKR